MHLHASAFGASDLGAPWGVRTEGIEALGVYVVLQGSAVLVVRRRSVDLAAGDVVLVRAGVAHELKDARSTRSVPFERLQRAAEGRARPFRWGGRGPRTRLVCGALVLDAIDGALFAAALPTHVHVSAARASPSLRSLLDGLAHEVADPGLAAPLVLTRFAELVFLHVLRACAETDAGPLGWLRGLGHPRIARALAAMYTAPERDWTVDSLAAKATMSRSAFAEAFRAHVGEPPLEHLTAWRMRRAARLLASRDVPLKAIAAQVGYGSDEAFSRAFRAWAGEPPGAWRRRSLE
ncbi:Transcriptional regulator, AraC family protein [Minicystis rosea]|nr:Transcriptional regulator, AraC family protein [Minicystis rosea]